MREIKFRAWNIKQAQYSGDYIPYMQYFGLMDLSEGYMGAGAGFIGDETKVMQYIGINDKNGKEIYEGDVVKITYYNNKNWEVQWNDYAAHFHLVTKHGNWHNIAENVSVEIIGNVWESPELMK